MKKPLPQTQSGQLVLTFSGAFSAKSTCEVKSLYRNLFQSEFWPKPFEMASLDVALRGGCWSKAQRQVQVFAAFLVPVTLANDFVQAVEMVAAKEDIRLIEELRTPQLIEHGQGDWHPMRDVHFMNVRSGWQVNDNLVGRGQRLDLTI